MLNTRLRVTPKNVRVPNDAEAVWNLVKYLRITKSSNEFCITGNSNNNDNYNYKFIVYPTKENNNDRGELLFGYPSGNEAVWIFNFTDSYTRVKIGNGEKYIKIKDDYLVLDETPTTWNLVKC